MHYARDGQTVGQISMAQIAEHVMANPGAKHFVYHGGAWVEPQEVPGMAALLNPTFRYASGGTDHGELSVNDIVDRMRGDKAGKHYVLQSGAWTPAKDVPAIQKALAGSASVPPPPGGSVPPPPA